MYSNDPRRFLFGEEYRQRCWVCSAWRLFILHARYRTRKNGTLLRVVCPCVDAPRYPWEEAAKHVHH